MQEKEEGGELEGREEPSCRLEQKKRTSEEVREWMTRKAKMQEKLYHQYMKYVKRKYLQLNWLR